MLPKPFDSSSHTVFSEWSERSKSKLFRWLHRKQKERSVQGAGITPEAVPRKSQEERNKGIASETHVSLAGLKMDSGSGLVVFNVGAG
jgi:hypothetical protein